jgi:hypothetical protein
MVYYERNINQFYKKETKNMKELVITADGLIVTRAEFIDLMQNGR